MRGSLCHLASVLPLAITVANDAKKDIKFIEVAQHEIRALQHVNGFILLHSTQCASTTSTFFFSETPKPGLLARPPSFKAFPIPVSNYVKVVESLFERKTREALHAEPGKRRFKVIPTFKCWRFSHDHLQHISCNS